MALGCKSKQAAGLGTAPAKAAPPERAGRRAASASAGRGRCAAWRRDERNRGWRAWSCTRAAGTEHPVIYDTVKMHQVVWTTDGKMHMNTGDRGDAVEFDVTQSVLPGLREAIELMVEGEKRRCWIPGTARVRRGGRGRAPRQEAARDARVRPHSREPDEESPGLPEAPPGGGRRATGRRRAARPAWLVAGAAGRHERQEARRPPASCRSATPAGPPRGRSS